MRQISQLSAVFLLGMAALSSAVLDNSTGAIRSEADGRVIQLRLPNEDVGIDYGERFPSFVVCLTAHSAAFEAQEFYIGDGSIAVPIYAHQSKGIFLQGDVQLKSGDSFKKGSVIKVKQGFKQAKELKPGEIYVILPGVTFEKPQK